MSEEPVALPLAPAARRVAVVLHYYEDLDDVEIARVLDCRPATVRSLVHRATRQLQEALR